MQTNVIYNEECIQGMQKLPDKSVDMILCDLQLNKVRYWVKSSKGE